MNWIDLSLLLLVAAVAALSAKRGLIGLTVGFGGLILLKPLLLLSQVNLWLALGAALLAALLSGLLGRGLEAGSRLPTSLSSSLGGVGGFLLGVMLVLALVTSLPVERDLNNRIVYPPHNLPPGVQGAVQQSRLMKLGSDILLYPLLAQSGLLEPSNVLGGLHNLLVVESPWTGGGG